MVGSVNSGRRHFETAVDRLAELPGWFIEAFVTDVVPHRSFERAFDRGATTIKTAVEFNSYEER